jgi:hypothetical protein
VELAVPFAHEPHAGLGLARHGLRRSKLGELLACLAGQTAVDLGLDLPGQGQAQQLGADPRHRPARDRGPFLAQLRWRKLGQHSKVSLEIDADHQPASTMR